MNIDRLAYLSKLKNKDPILKIVFALLTMSVCLWANNRFISVTVMLTMGGLTIAWGKIPFKVFMRFIFLPLSFLMVGAASIAMGVSADGEGLLFRFLLRDRYVGLSTTGTIEAIALIFKAMGAVSCLYFLTLNTPMVSLMSAMRRLKAPTLLLELMGLTYRFLFVLFETAETIFTAQKARLGYVRISCGYRSLGMLLASVFIRAYKRSDELYLALESRGYEGELSVLEEPYERNRMGFLLAVAYNMGLVALAVFLKLPQWGGGFHWIL